MGKRAPPGKLVCATCGEAIGLYMPATLSDPVGSVTHFCRVLGAHETRAPRSQLERELVQHASQCFRRVNPI